MKIEADFSQISSDTSRLAPDTYKFVVKSAAPGEEKAGKQTPFIVESEVASGARQGATIQDYIYLKTRDGGANKIGLGRVKAYAEATLGAERANAKDFDTDELIGNAFDGIVIHEPYTDSSTTPPTQKMAVRLDKILPSS